MSEITERVRIVLDRAAEAAVSCGRDPAEITVAAATKMNDADRVREAIRAGIRVCGENRVQELLEKWEQGAYEGARTDFIGTLQRNKVRQLIGKARLIQSVGSAEVLGEIQKRAAAAGVRQQVLLEVNVGREAEKSGFLPEAVDEAAALAGELSAVELRGVMAIPPASASEAETVEYFQKMYHLFIDLRAKKYDNRIDCLSMGMSRDYPAAIREGATLVRVGTAIFGPRQYSQP